MFKHPSIFITSSGRSGTTLLISVLNFSKQISIPYESDFVARAYPFYQQKRAFDESDYVKLAHIFYETSIPKGWGLAEQDFLQNLLQYSPQTFADVHAVLCKSYHERSGTGDLLWGIKAPVLIASIDRIRDVHPEAKIVHIVRDGRDVFLSYKRVHQNSEVKFGPKGAVSNALYWVDGLRRIEKYQKGDIFEIRYEDLLKQTDLEMEKLFTLLDLKRPLKSFGDFQGISEGKIFADNKVMKELHQKVASGIDSTNIKKYLKGLSSFEIFVFELLAIPYLVKYAYEPEYTFLNIGLFAPIRFIAYFLARKINNYRYQRRDIRVYNH